MSDGGRKGEGEEEEVRRGSGRKERGRENCRCLKDVT